MTECDNAEMRDLLPDLVNDVLSAEERERVQAHVASCSACSDEVSLLRAMRAARPVAPRIDVARIVSALPAALPTARPGAHPSALPRSVGRPLARKRPVLSGVWRMAATVAVAAVGGWSVLTYQRAGTSLDATARTSAPTAAGAVPRIDSLSAGNLRVLETAGGRVAMADTPRAGSGTSPAGGSTTRQTALSLGDLSDYSDDDLQRMLDRLEKWDGTTAADPVPTVPIVPVTERGTR